MWNHLTIWNSVALVIAAAGLGLLAWALFADRAKNRLRCPKCWYSLDGTPADDAGLRKCPECGRGSLRERSLKRTRRRWRYVFLALLVFVFADQSRRIPAANEHGWVAFVPTTLIIPLAPIQSERWARQTLDGTSDLTNDRWSWIDALREEVFRRDRDEEVWSWQGNLWVVLATWRPMGDEKLVSKSFGIGELLDRNRFSELPVVLERRTALLFCLMCSVGPETWTAFGNDQSFATVLSDRLLVFSSQANIDECGRFITQMEHPTEIGAPPDLRSIVRSEPEDNWVRVVYDAYPVFARFSVDSTHRGDLEFEIANQVACRSGPDDWIDNGGDGFTLRWYEARLFVEGRRDLVEQCCQNLQAGIEAALRKFDSDCTRLPE